MRPVLQNQPEIGSVSAALLGALRALVAAIQTGWNTQHNGDGTHDNVTAAALSVSGTTSLGKLNLRVGNYRQPGLAGNVNDIAAQDVAMSSVSILRITHPANPLLVTGIDATGRQQGDLLLVINADETVGAPADLWLQCENAASQPQNRFAETLATPGAPGANYVIQGARAVWLVYDFQITIFGGAGSQPQPRWRIIDQA